MSVTCCVGPVERELRAAKAITPELLREVCRRQATACPRTDCSPGGCRKHVIEFCTGVAARAGIAIKERTT